MKKARSKSAVGLFLILLFWTEGLCYQKLRRRPAFLAGAAEAVAAAGVC